MNNRYVNPASFLFSFGLNKITSLIDYEEELETNYLRLYYKVNIPKLMDIVEEADTWLSEAFYDSEFDYKTDDETLKWFVKRLDSETGIYRNVHQYDLVSALFSIFTTTDEPKFHYPVLLSFIDKIRDVVPFDYRRYTKYLVNKYITLALKHRLAYYREQVLLAINYIMFTNKSLLLDYSFDGFISTERIRYSTFFNLRFDLYDLFIKTPKIKILQKSDELVIKGDNKYRPLLYDELIKKIIVDKIPYIDVVNVDFISNLQERFFRIRTSDLVGYDLYLTDDGKLDYEAYLSEFEQKYEMLKFLNITQINNS